MKDILKNKFDKIHVLTMSHRKDRQEGLKKQLNNIGITEDDYKDLNLHWYYGTLFPFNEICAASITRTRKGLFSKPNEFDCSRNHYSIVKQAYDMGVEHLLVIEDDIRFMNDKELMKKFIDEIPSDYDIIQFGGFTMDKKATKILDEYDNGKYWVKHRDVAVWTTAMYALSRRGMKFYIAFMDKFFSVADMPLYKAPINDKLVNVYISTKPIVVQADKNLVSSDIRSKENDDIDYTTQNTYESRVKDDEYFEY